MIISERNWIFIKLNQQFDNRHWYNDEFRHQPGYFIFSFLHFFPCFSSVNLIKIAGSEFCISPDSFCLTCRPSVSATNPIFFPKFYPFDCPCPCPPPPHILSFPGIDHFGLPNLNSNSCNSCLQCAESTWWSNVVFYHMNMNHADCYTMGGQSYRCCVQFVYTTPNQRKREQVEMEKNERNDQNIEWKKVLIILLSISGHANKFLNEKKNDWYDEFKLKPKSETW